MAVLLRHLFDIRSAALVMVLSGDNDCPRGLKQVSTELCRRDWGLENVEARCSELNIDITTGDRGYKSQVPPCVLVGPRSKGPGDDNHTRKKSGRHLYLEFVKSYQCIKRNRLL